MAGEAIYYVYVLFRPWDGSPFYVGKGKGNRWKDHERYSAKGRNRHLANIIRKAKALKLEIPKIKIHENLTEAAAFGIEAALIAAIGRKQVGGPLVNLTDGGDGTSGHVVPKEIAARSSLRMKALWTDPVWRANMIANNKGNTYTLGHKLSDEHRAKIGASNHGRPGVWTGKKLSAEHRINIGRGNIGRRHTDKTCRKISIAATGRSPSQTTRQKMRAAKLGGMLSDEHKEKIAVKAIAFAATPEGRAMKSRAAKIRWTKKKEEKQPPH